MIQDEIQICNVFLVILSSDQDVILNACYMLKALENDVHGALKYRWGRSDAKGQPFVAVEAMMSVDSDILLTVWVQWQLLICTL